jgi:hypothetical protein
MVRRTHLSVHCTPLERRALVSCEVYRHLAPLEPEHRLVVVSALRQAFCFPRSPFPLPPLLLRLSYHSQRESRS